MFGRLYLRIAVVICLFATSHAFPIDWGTETPLPYQFLQVMRNPLKDPTDVANFLSYKHKELKDPECVTKSLTRADQLARIAAGFVITSISVGSDGDTYNVVLGFSDGDRSIPHVIRCLKK